MTDCDHTRLDMVVCIVPGDKQPNGYQYPRCVCCGHRTQYVGMAPPSTRSIMKRHPFYLFKELYGREKAKTMRPVGHVC